MCIPKPPKPPAPPQPPRRDIAEDNADALRRRLAARRGYAASVKTGQYGADDYGSNSQGTGLSNGTAKQLGTSA